MNTIETNLLKYIDNAVSYQQYLSDIQEIISAKSAPEDMQEYYQLNLQRMNRLDKTLILNENLENRIQNLTNPISFLIISEGWCSDAAQIIPVVVKIAEANPILDVKIVYRDQNEELMNQYLTNDSKSIPIVIGVDKNTGEEKFVWGPRPAFCTQILRQYKAGDFTFDEFKVNLQKAYNKDKGNAIIEELLTKLEIDED
ncbi:MAG: thioredoxin family protein [Flavobacteriaceae bacterium]|nr:thioredoxin family protein [Flavobacteriaceae bacterium]